MKPIAEEKRRHQPLIELINPEQCRVYNQETVAADLEAMGFGPSKRLVDAMYISEDNEYGIAVVRVNKERCQDHFLAPNPQIFRGHDQGEAMAQGVLLLGVYSGKITGENIVTLGEVWEQFDRPAFPGTDLNIVVTTEKQEGILGYGEVYAGRRMLTAGYVRGNIASRERVGKILDRMKREQAKAIPVFPMPE